ncbi:MAG TPA: phage tail sheath subtilisin-like domain-containing protein [Arachnia sp.]|nr:phage tail sheath subtilisin-like domain-containing protein [Arachnia sp.]HMT85310.1 phage tail sheath subtilisin-like domain-containing protein [Arachnia sp.]
MTLLATPGIYRRTLEPSYRMGSLARGDVAVLLGYAERGPTGVPIRLQSLSQFEEVFGQALRGGYLWHGVKGFFECGGAAAYAIRIVDRSASEAVASGWLGAPPDDARYGWRAEASFPWAMVDPRRVNRETRADLAVWQALVDAEIRERGSRVPDPGSWGNALRVDVASSSLALTHTTEVLDRGTGLRLASIAGLEAASIVRLSQVGGDRRSLSAVVGLDSVDPARRLVRLPVSLGDLAAFDETRRIEVASVEFDVTVSMAGRILQTFPRLAPHPRHSRALRDVMDAESRHVGLRWTTRADQGADPADATDPADVDWALAAHWPQEGAFTLSGGQDALSGMGPEHWRDAFALLPPLSDAAMIAAPDLVRDDVEPAPVREGAETAPSCGDISPRAPGFLSGLVVTPGTIPGEEEPVAEALIEVAGPGGSARSDLDGRFSLSGVTLGLVDLRVTKPGFQTLELLAQTQRWPGAAEVTAGLVRLVTPPVLDDDAVLLLQQDLGNPAVVGPWKVALIDPPRTIVEVDGFRSRAAELGPEPRLGLLAPWLEVPDPSVDGGRLAVPPSGHVAGAFARAELDEGIFRSGANLPLRYACGTTLAIDDDLQAGLNPVGVNAIRAFEGRGIRLYGTRSLAIGTPWQFLTVRRIVDAVEKTLQASLATFVFEPNSTFLRDAARASVEAFLGGLWREGHLAGDSPEAAFRVTCDDENNPQETTDAGQLLIEVAIAPTVPFEFIMFRIGHAFDAVQITEVA